MRRNDIRLTRHFKLREFECRCCGTVKLSPTLLQHLETLRREWNRPLVVTSGYRCEKHNAAVGGGFRSRHKEGRAADVRVPAAEQEAFAALAKQCGFVKVIRYGERNFVHLEV